MPPARLRLITDRPLPVQYPEATQTPMAAPWSHELARDAGVVELPLAADVAPDIAPTSIDSRLLRYLLQSLGNPPVHIDLWNGASVSPASGTSIAHLRIGNRASLLKLLLDPEAQFGECFCNGSVEVEGDLVSLLGTLIRTESDHTSSASSAHRIIERLMRPRARTVSILRNKVFDHSDLGSAFYGLRLDRQLACTCAYFASPDVTLEAAQIAQMDHVCHKLKLHPGETVVEAGCGWGALALHMATRYGVRVKGFNNSHQQIAYATERAHELGVDARVEFIEDDYRNIRGPVDAFVSVGRLSNSVREDPPEFGRFIDRVLRPDGRGLIHSFGQPRSGPMNAWIANNTFPGPSAPSLRDMLEVLEPSRFSVLDVENLHLHYALTLEHWLRRFEEAHERVRDTYDEHFVRVWRLCLSGACAAFSAGSMQLFQVLLARPSSDCASLTRADLHATQR